MGHSPWFAIASPIPGQALFIFSRLVSLPHFPFLLILRAYACLMFQVDHLVIIPTIKQWLLSLNPYHKARLTCSAIMRYLFSSLSDKQVYLFFLQGNSCLPLVAFWSILIPFFLILSLISVSSTDTSPQNTRMQKQLSLFKQTNLNHANQSHWVEGVVHPCL